MSPTTMHPDLFQVNRPPASRRQNCGKWESQADMGAGLSVQGHVQETHGGWGAAGYVQETCRGLASGHIPHR
jgi:hypothetical protein